MEYQTQKIRHISHEVKNQLSICDLYTEILERYCEKNNIDDETIKKSVNCIKNAIQMAGVSLLELKSSYSQELKKYCAKELIEEAYQLSKVYGLAKQIDFVLKIDLNDEEILSDKNRFQSIIVNLVKNACEAFCEEEDKRIIISAEKEKEFIKIIVSNNAKPIEDVDIFKEGITTKESGSGLGLYISRTNIEEMGGSLRLIKSDKNSTDFEIMVKVM